MEKTITLSEKVLDELNLAYEYGNDLAEEILSMVEPNTDYVLDLDDLDWEAKEYLMDILSDLGEL